MFEDLKPHIKDLRYRLLVSILSLICITGLCFLFWEVILEFVTIPIKNILGDGGLIAIKVQEKFFVALKVSFFAALLFSLPIIFWQFWKFVSPALYANEKRILIPFVLSASLMFLLGASFCYYVVIPFGLEFLVNFASSQADSTISIGEYVGFFSKVLFGFGLAFELPVVVAFLAKIGLVNEKSLMGFFKYAVIIIFVLSAILTPPDVFTQFLMSLPLILLYGVSILIAKVINPSLKD